MSESRPKVSGGLLTSDSSRSLNFPRERQGAVMRTICGSPVMSLLLQTESTPGPLFGPISSCRLSHPGGAILWGWGAFTQAQSLKVTASFRPSGMGGGGVGGVATARASPVSSCSIFFGGSAQGEAGRRYRPGRRSSILGGHNFII